MCGEKQQSGSSPTEGEGSPPRVRGKGEMLCIMCGSSRITPACAGKRNPGHNALRSGQDHPRVCGEKRPDLLINEFNPGSPPRVRGKDQAQLKVNCMTRITPACAGKRLKNSLYIGVF